MEAKETYCRGNLYPPLKNRGEYKFVVVRDVEHCLHLYA
jgi:hypothetical protein